MTHTLIAKKFIDSVRPPHGMWTRVDVLCATDSTHTRAVADPTPWRLIVADHQESGRGRRGRAWSAPPGSALLVSAVVPLPRDRTTWGWFPLLTGVAMVRALRDVTGLESLRLKWPNDILVEDAALPAAAESASWGAGKLAGILCEAVPGDEHDVGILGVGVNVTVPRSDLPVPSALSLHHALGLSDPAPRDDARLSREAMLEAFSTHVARLVTTWNEADGARGAVRDDYVQLCATIGRQIEVHTPSGEVVGGRAVDVSAEGGLLVHTLAGERMFTAGEVVHVRAG